MRSNAAAPTVAETWGAMAASVWNTSTVTFSTRDGSTARMLAGNGVPSVIGISPPSSPGSRTPITCSTPFTSFVSSVFPSTTTASARTSPSWATYSPGVRWMSSTSPARYSSAFSSSAEKSGIVASSSIVNMIASQSFPLAFPQPKTICWHLVARVPLICGSDFGCGVENLHAEMVDRTTMAAHEASASNMARLGRMDRLLQTAWLSHAKRSVPIAAILAMSAV